MARDIHKVIITGRFGKDPEIKYVGNDGLALAKFSVGVSTGFGDKGFTKWYNCEVWRQTAEYVAQYANKGSRVAIEGYLKDDEYDDKTTGAKRVWTKLVVQELVLLDPRQERDDDEAPRSSGKSWSGGNSRRAQSPPEPEGEPQF